MTVRKAGSEISQDKQTLEFSTGERDFLSVNTTGVEGDSLY
jgi:hypothetical protein